MMSIPTGSQRIRNTIQLSLSEKFVKMETKHGQLLIFKLAKE